MKRYTLQRSEICQLCGRYIEDISIEINLRKCKWFLFATYHPPSQYGKYFFDYFSRGLDIYSALYDKFVLIEDFNAKDSEDTLAYFLNCHNASMHYQIAISLLQLS